MGHTNFKFISIVVIILVIVLSLAGWVFYRETQDASLLPLAFITICFLVKAFASIIRRK